MLWHAYVDESGDRGWKPPTPGLPPGKKTGSSRIFSATAILVPDGIQTAALTAWDAAGVAIGRNPGAMIHFHDVKGTGPRKFLVQTVAQVPNIQVISVVLCKHHLTNVSKLTDPKYLYGWTLRLLVERISYFGKQHNAKVKMTFAQVKGVPKAELFAYFQKLYETVPNIEWGHLHPPARIDIPANRRMLQLADTASAGIFTAFEPDPFGFTDQSYLHMLKPVLWRRPGRPLQKEGLKYGPWVSGSPTPPAPCHAEHPWLAGFCA